MQIRIARCALVEADLADRAGRGDRHVVLQSNELRHLAGSVLSHRTEHSLVCNHSTCQLPVGRVLEDCLHLRDGAV